jgi:uncharacterized protein (TIGR03000 family)
MRKQTISLLAMAVLVVFGTLWSSKNAAAQYSYTPARQYPFVDSIMAPMTYGRYTEGPGFFYTGEVRDPGAPEEQVAYLHIRLSPPDGTVNFDGAATRQVGGSRLFWTPPLKEGETYTYNLTVTWNINGKKVTKERKVPVSAGDRLSLVFRAPKPDTSTSATQMSRGANK